MSTIEFGQEELKMLLELKNEAENFEIFRHGAEQRIDSLEELIKNQQIIINNLLWASSKVALIAGGGFAGFMAAGYWLMDTLHWKAVVQFFKTLRGE